MVTMRHIGDTWGVPKIRGTVLGEAPKYSILGSILESLILGLSKE